MFSKKMTMFNVFINGLCLGAIFGLVQLNDAWKSSPITFSLREVSVPLFFLAIFLSVVFMFMDKCCGSCLTVTCCNIKDQTRIFDPDQEDQDGVHMEKVQRKDEEFQYVMI